MCGRLLSLDDEFGQDPLALDPAAPAGAEERGWPNHSPNQGWSMCSATGPGSAVGGRGAHFAFWLRALTAGAAGTSSDLRVG